MENVEKSVENKRGRSSAVIQKLRMKFVAICMALVTAVLAAVLLAVFFSTQANISALRDQTLRRAIQEDTLGAFNKPHFPPENDSERAVLLPYFTVNLFGATAYVTGGTYDDLENTAVLQDIITQCLAQNLTEGTITQYRLQYLRQDMGLYTRLAFVDMSMEIAIVARMMGSYLAIAAIALLVLLGVSIGLSILVTRPVEKAWRQQRQFLSDASHELKTPLTVILANAELLEDAPMDDAPARWVDNIHASAGQMRTLVEEMLTLARADNAVPTVHVEEVNFSELASDTALAFEPVAFEAGKALEYGIAGDAAVLGDGEKLRRLLSVLLDNAIKYGADGRPIRLELTRTEKQLRLMVENEGTPIPPEQLEHLFERFYRADASRGEKSGFGLGLSIAASVAAEHKGSLKAESDAKSTRFIYTMALKK